ncbi:aminoacyl peptidase [Pseudidiomarina salinarum]|uniref:Aminoacyl peptidase n=1 Tax=Pseudidiomarina salinarum TaxID=435908 RepID=A0A094IVC2_9GAMM|nr:prolyl oligopeptidase family serine peptidase [Pseudidiomarina salinarum]KFZ31072.1 aminoacyl peptidase [Pseudidiomarina salinarum]RUO71154.1 S9 family peptidase [Pseudidiomarina salinarum]
MKNLTQLLALTVGLAFAASLQSAAANPVKLDYQKPAQEIIDIVDAAPSPGAGLSPDGRLLVVTGYPALPEISDLAAPEYKLAGRRINPANNSISQARYINKLSLIDVNNGNETAIKGLPKNLKVIGLSWAPDSSAFAFLQMNDDAVNLWHVDVAKQKAKRWSKEKINAVWGSQIEWSHDSKGVYVLTVPGNRGEEPKRNPVPTGPVITESRGRSAPARTYQDLLQGKYDEALFDYYFTSQVMHISTRGKATELNIPAVIDDISLSPNDDYLLVTTLQAPYSYAVPHYRFARTTDVWNTKGRTIYQVVDQPLADDMPIAFDAVVTGRRDISWRNDADATLVWAQATDGGDPANEAEIRDQVFQLAAPFTGEPQKLVDLSKRYARLLAADAQHALVWERWWADRDEKLWLVDTTGANEPRLVWERSWEDRYNNPGTPQTITRDGRQLLYLADGAMLLTGDGASDEGDRPFIDRYYLSDGRTERLWRSAAPYYEEPVDLIDPAALTFLTRREAVDEPADFYIRDLKQDKLTALTDTSHPMPHTLGISRELIHYEREDGLAMSAKLFLPAGYDKEKDGPLPTIVWAYPREYKSSSAAAQVSGSPYEFNRISYWTPQFLATQGYAVMDAATMPIVGEGAQRPNDSFLEQLVMNGKAVIKAGVDRGVTDPERVALGGHSYGAFMTANILAHSDLFAAGVARSGAYNRSLTPFGFQREERTVWDDAELYVRMSPFFHANKINEPLLMIHGMNDNNSGTFPMQSERLYQAVKGLGGTSRLVMLPLESHGYRARESVLHMLWETTNWLDEFVKNKPASE